MSLMLKNESFRNANLIAILWEVQDLNYTHRILLESVTSRDFTKCYIFPWLQFYLMFWQWISCGVEEVAIIIENNFFWMSNSVWGGQASIFPQYQRVWLLQASWIFVLHLTEALENLLDCWVICHRTRLENLFLPKSQTYIR